MPRLAEPEPPESRVVGIFRPVTQGNTVAWSKYDEDSATENDELINHSLDILELNKRKNVI
ncbi:hypothetical protein TUM13189_28600 [Citrobacter koseri]|nr:hypothetical protein TUM13189_28600 [Citrobacter koseri]